MVLSHPHARQELLGSLIERMPEHLFGGAFFLDGTVVHEDHMASYPAKEAHFAGCDHHGVSVFGERERLRSDEESSASVSSVFPVMHAKRSTMCCSTSRIWSAPSSRPRQCPMKGDGGLAHVANPRREFVCQWHVVLRIDRCVHGRGDAEPCTVHCVPIVR